MWHLSAFAFCEDLHGKICKTDKNGNAGRAYTNYYKRHSNQTRCHFFAWVDPTLSPPSSRFASSSLASSLSRPQFLQQLRTPEMLHVLPNFPALSLVAALCGSTVHVLTKCAAGIV